MLGTVEDVVLRRFKLTCSQEYRLNNILHTLNGWEACRLRRNDIHHPPGQLLNRNLRGTPHARETFPHRVGDPLGVKSNNTPVALDDGARHHHASLIQSGKGSNKPSVEELAARGGHSSPCTRIHSVIAPTRGAHAGSSEEFRGGRSPPRLSSNCQTGLNREFLVRESLLS